ncbi:hypothetical protein RUM44_005706 [Polyplax serrata]|uniref:Uncharacterized protein n=1 Tax=Polyplax serrata TaxID=468196 RepID=A0ABR1AWE2_POLSC
MIKVLRNAENDKKRRKKCKGNDVNRTNKMNFREKALGEACPSPMIKRNGRGNERKKKLNVKWNSKNGCKLLKNTVTRRRKEGEEVEQVEKKNYNYMLRSAMKTRSKKSASHLK